MIRGEARRTKTRCMFCDKMVCSKTTTNSQGETQQRKYDWDSGRCLPIRLHSCAGFDKGNRVSKITGHQWNIKD